VNVYYLTDKNRNLGDHLNKPVLEWLGFKVNYVGRPEKGKFIGIGSICSSIQPGDVVWGAGSIRNQPLIKPFATYLAVRGRLTRRLLINGRAKVPKVYGDPALLLPLMYNPDVEQIHDVGYIPHYIQKHKFNLLFKNKHQIDIQTLDWKKFVREIKQCKKIISSSLHGIVIAEAYGIPAEWQDWGGGVIGDGFKFRDYLTGTGREEQGYGEFPPIPNLKWIQDNLIKAIKEYYGHNKT